MEIVGAELREVAKVVPNVQKLECLALHFAKAAGNARERIKLNDFRRWTVICDRRSVRFARAVILASGPNTERVSHYHTRANCCRSVRFVRSDILTYGPFFRLAVCTFRTDRHP